MKAIIIEDEPHALQRLQRLLTEIAPDTRIVATVDSVKKAVQWFVNNPCPDFALMDIQLADGLSFQIFEQCAVDCPVIFTTAYDEYALKAFKSNGVDYILKPVDKDELEAALQKVTRTSSRQPAEKLLENINAAMKMLTKKYKSRFVIKVGEHLKTVEVENARYFFSQEKATFCATDENRKYILDYTLDQLEEMLDPEVFFRINRKYIVRSGAIQDIIHYTNSRLRLILKESDDSDIIVARERVQEFREWLDK